MEGQLAIAMQLLNTKTHFKAATFEVCFRAQLIFDWRLQVTQSAAE